MSKQSWLKAAWPPVVVVMVLLLVWQLAAMWWHVPGWLLPTPLQIIHEGINAYSRLWMHTASTIQITLIGFSIGVGVGLVMACMLHMVPGFKSGFYPLLILSQNIPTIALAPLLIIWFGFGLLPKIIVITLVCFFPITIATLDGFMQTDRHMYSYMKLIGASRKQIFFKLELPNALPFVFSGLKISATYSVMGAVIAEWLGSGEGIGTYMMLQKASYRADREFVAIFIIICLSLLFFGLITLLEKLIIRWNTKA
ncbi:ABC transporter permease [Paenibacillus eucommiae]|uniref:ABC-type nitrate/sulfonate/bicarbonate transport system permease component n=1 Tax=Paenibacillus eucommiae TaxID=1355755 RepID=A0ABS4J660_9BACL|nr:ABC transporter permease [Paenibacillus eucommiae]MBP1995298.1 ABC-type nitrate/sulfonate/bicarbonate transport system permease component [Paenibacillus eucommiae]